MTLKQLQALPCAHLNQHVIAEAKVTRKPNSKKQAILSQLKPSKAVVPKSGDTPDLPTRTTNQGNIRCVVDGHKFQSKKEGRRYSELRLLERSGGITDLRMQVPYLLVKDGAVEYTLTYIADFVYKQNGIEIVEDVKPFDKKKKEYRLSQTFKQKQKLMLKRFGIVVKIY